LRLKEGILLEDIKRECNAEWKTFVSSDILSRLQKETLLEITPTHFKATQRGRMVLNSLMVELV
jgi:coproporphyrinogen III oxidase-like Fe-S oxidoreductase